MRTLEQKYFIATQETSLAVQCKYFLANGSVFCQNGFGTYFGSSLCTERVIHLKTASFFQSFFFLFVLSLIITAFEPILHILYFLLYIFLHPTRCQLVFDDRLSFLSSSLKPVFHLINISSHRPCVLSEVVCFN